MSTAIHGPPPDIRVGRLVKAAARLRRVQAPPRPVPAAPRSDEVRLLLYLGVGGAACLFALALCGLLLSPRGGSATADLAPVEIALVSAASEPELLPAPDIFTEAVAVAIPETAPLPDVLPPETPERVVVADGPDPSEVSVIQRRPQTACEKFGTQIVFLSNPPDAFKKARDENKLVFFVHLSGNFEDKEFT